MSSLRTRLAPSPTGHLHLGHVLHIMYVQGIAANLGADIVLRIEDHDQSRCRPEFEASICEDLAWLGVTAPKGLWRQSHRDDVYRKHLEDLMRRHLIYACSCSRKDVQSSIGQHSGELTYPGTCRGRPIPLNQEETCLRLVIPDESFSLVDCMKGPISQNPAHQCGDVVVRDRLKQWTYQFAVVIDDLDQGINLIIRGEDLLSSTGRQLAMRKLIKPDAPVPIFVHHPLIANPAGQKLSKRILSESLKSYSRTSLGADELRGFVANLAGLTPDASPIKLDRLPELFRGIGEKTST